MKGLIFFDRVIKINDRNNVFNFEIVIVVDIEN